MTQACERCASPKRGKVFRGPTDSHMWLQLQQLEDFGIGQWKVGRGGYGGAALSVTR